MISYVDGTNEGFSEEEFADVKRCLETLLSVEAGSQPLDRDFGIDYEGIVGYPIPVAENMLALEITEKVERYEPRVEIEKIEFTSHNAQIVPHIYFNKAESEVEE